MSTFTMQTKDAVDYLGGVVTFENGLLKVEGNVGLSNYEIFDEAHREQLNSKILRNYWMWEIGVETAELWRFNMETSMSLIMPYYNQLYASEKTAFDPFKTVDIQTTAGRELNRTGSVDTEFDRTNSSSRELERDSNSSSETTQDGTNDSKSRAVNSAFPQSQLAGNRDYATSATDSTSSGSSAANSEGVEQSHATDSESEQGQSLDKGSEQSQVNDNESSDSRTSGYQGIPSDLMLAFRQTILNLDQDIVNSLQDNFMGIWHDGSRYFDSYSVGRYIP